MAKVISICGSLRKGSYNRMVLSHLPDWAPAGMTIAEAPPFVEFPLYNADDQNATGFPAPVSWPAAARCGGMLSDVTSGGGNSSGKRGAECGRISGEKTR